MGPSNSPSKDRNGFAVGGLRYSDRPAPLDALAKETSLLRLSPSPRRPTPGPPDLIDGTSDRSTCLLDLPHDLILEVIEHLLGDDRYGGYDDEETTTDFPEFHRFDVWKDVANFGASCKHLYAYTMPKLYREDVKENYCSALLLSAKSGNASAVSWSLNQGADVNIEDHTELDILYDDYCCDTEVTRYSIKTDMNALHWAAFHHHLDILALLLKRGADIHARAEPPTEARCQPYLQLMSAFESHLLCHLENAHGTTFNDMMWVRTSIKSGANALYFAVLGDNREICCNPVPSRGRRQIASRQKSRVATARLLSQAGVSHITHTGLGLHALHQACGNWDYNMASFFLQNGSESDNAMIRDRLGNTPLHFLAVCASYRRPDPRCVIDLLLSHGADINAVNFAGLTPLQLCFQMKDPSGRGSLVNFRPVCALIEAGAHVFPGMATSLHRGPWLPLERVNAAQRKKTVEIIKEAEGRLGSVGRAAISERDRDYEEARGVHVAVYKLLGELSGQSEGPDDPFESHSLDHWKTYWKNWLGIVID